ncbi:MAG: M20/M25/M40 family metallo-hydrolase [Planctomycetota bacterium]|nr:M20/M25/M40 family metallo-hydrolase [Planctomycetota bacterium]
MATKGSTAARSNLALLKKLCEVPGVAGREERVRALIEREIHGLFDGTSVDPMGSLICTRKSRGASSKKGRTAPKKVLIAAHMDEIGFYVRFIDEQGFVWVNPAGGFDPRNLFSRRVLLVTETGDLEGVMNPGGKPIHISSESERNKIPGTEEFFIDLGRTADDVKKLVQVGDYVVMHEPFLDLPKCVVSKALDNRFACFVAIEAMRIVAREKKGHSRDIVVAFTTQEEVGLRGAQTAANAVGADIGIGLDVNLACDTPGVPDSQRVTKHGLGAAIMVQDSSMISDASLVREFCTIATSRKIPHQRAVLPRGGQDAGAIQRAGRGARCIAIGSGTRYIHTVTEMIDKSDLQAAIDLVAAYLLTD